jgi:hypothetical protein
MWEQPVDLREVLKTPLIFHESCEIFSVAGISHEVNATGQFAASRM